MNYAGVIPSKGNQDERQGQTYSILICQPPRWLTMNTHFEPSLSQPSLNHYHCSSSTTYLIMVDSITITTQEQPSITQPLRWINSNIQS